jgi:hypothetical protein
MLRGVEYAPLRPVPLTPAGPVDPERATAHVSALLPRLPEDHARALALVALGGRTRAETAREIGVAEPELARALARARCELRRSVRRLEGSGWCLRAEALVSDRLDDVLDEAGAPRLDVHLRNCPRCVEHERRLVQAQNALVAEFGRAPAEGEHANLSLVPPAEAPELQPRSASTLLVTASQTVLLVLAALLLIAAIAFAVAAVVGG